MQPAMTQQQAKFSDEKKSRLAMYKEYVVGNKSSMLALTYYEFCMFFFGNLSGLPGFATRSLFFPSLFAKCGRKPAFGKGLVIRNPASISIGKALLVDDYASLDVRGDDSTITIGDHVSIGRFSIIAAKGGTISLGNACNIGTSCRIATNSKIEFGESVLVAAYSYIGPGNHQQGDDETPLIAREMEIKGGVTIGDHAWIGARATILDGVQIGKRSIVGAHSLVKENVPDDCIAVGSPARIIQK